MNEFVRLPIGRLLPHEPPMILLDEALSFDGTTASAALTVTARSPFCDAALGGVPSHVGIEYMAQTCGVFAGITALAAEQPVRLGFLLGTRKYLATAAVFPIGARLVVTAEQKFAEAGMFVFDCRIAQEGAVLASAQLNLYQPENAEAFLKGEGNV